MSYFLLRKNVHIDDFSEMIDWAYENKNNETVLILTSEYVISYQNKGLWEIISSKTDNWLFGLYEDDWIFDFDVMKSIVLALQS